MAGLRRHGRQILWNNTAQPAGATSPSFDVSKIELISIFIEVSAATDVIVETETIRGWQEIKGHHDRLTFTAAGKNWVHFWATGIGNIRVKTTAAATITAEIHWKT